jgi:DNA modification methylase
MPDEGVLYLDAKVQSETLKGFIAKHVRPYDPATDDYDRPPFAADIKEGKNDPVYNAHSYHTKVPPRSIVPYILHYTQPGDLVVDMFCGSGMTGVATQMCVQPPADILGSFPELNDRVGPRACILNDLSPAACHIAYNYNTPVDIEALKLEFNRIKATVEDEFDWLYGTEHYEPAVGVYDVSDQEVACRLKNPPGGKTKHNLLEEEERTWELLNKAEVETRLGYPVTELTRDEKWLDLDLAKVDQWICIPAAIQYTIWSDVYRCEGFITIEEPTGKVSTRGKNAGKPIVTKKRAARGCGHEIVLWDVAVDDPAGNVRDDFNCPSCNQKWTKCDLDYIRAVPVFVAIDVGRLTGTDGRYYRRISRREVEKVAQLEKEPIHDWYPDQEIYPHRELMSMGVTKHGVSRISDFYTRRNLRALARLWAEVSKSQVIAPLRFLITSTFSHVERTTRYKFRRGGNSSLAGLLYIGSITVEDNIMRQLDTKIRQVAKGLGQLAKLGNSSRSACLVNKGSADDLAWLPDCSVDFIFTDPPFGGNIFYSDASMLYEAWLGEFTDEKRELVYHRRSKQQREKDGYVFKTPEDYSQGMATAFREMFRVLKPGRWATVEFNNSDGAVFEAIKDGVRKAGFEIANMLLLDKEQKTFKQLQGADGTQDVVDKDVLFNLHKPSAIRIEVRSEDHDLEQQVVEAVRRHLQTLPERVKAEPAKYNDEHRTTATINSMLMNALIPRGVSVERLNLPFIEHVCARYFRKIGQHWYLRGESVGGDNGNTLIEEEVSVQDEVTAIAWLRQRVQQKPMPIGELKPLWMRATGLLPAAMSRELSLDMLLSENFWRDPDSNRWREPTNEEREKMNDDRSIRVLHDAERYVAGSLHRTSSDEERCEWIEVLFKACRQVEDGDMQSVPALRGFDAGEGYRLITRLFQGVMRERVPADVYARAQKQAGAASNRISQGVRDDDELRKAEVAKSRGPSLFDEVD